MSAKLHITKQWTVVCPITGESVTVYIADNSHRFAFALSFRHDETSKTLNWTSHYEGILQIQSKVNKDLWFMWLTQYWDGGGKDIPTEEILCVSRVTVKFDSK